MMTATNKKAFTLIELLVVISIIALLVGILLPALGAARESARGVVCQTNMKNLSTAFVSYATDNQGFWPSWATGGYPSLKDSTCWVPSGFLNSATGQEPYDQDLADGALWQYTPDYNVFSCPSDPWVPWSMGLSYSMSHLITQAPRANFPGTWVEPGVVYDGGTEGKYIYPQSDKFVEPSHLIFLVDEGGAIEGQPDLGVNDGYFQYMDVNVDPGHISAGYPNYGTLTGAFNGNGDKSKWYHKEGAAFAFADGHGEIRKRSDKEIYAWSNRQLVGKNKNRVFEFSRIWDPAAQAPLIAGEE